MKKLLILLIALLLVSCPALAQEYVIDHANLLSSGEEQALLEKINQISAAHDLDIVILLENDINKSPRYYAADYYDYSGYADDGLLFLLSMAERDYFVLTSGRAISVFTDYGLAQMENTFVPYLSRGDYYEGISAFLSLSEAYLDHAASGTIYDVKNPLVIDPGTHAVRSVTVFDRANEVFPIVLIIAAVIALITVFILKGQLKTVRKQAGARSYVKEGSFQLTRQQDIYLYTTTRRRKIETSSSSSGGSSTFRGSSGASHGGRGGKF